MLNKDGQDQVKTCVMGCSGILQVLGNDELMAEAEVKELEAAILGVQRAQMLLNNLLSPDAWK